MRFLLLVLLCLASVATAQRKFGKVYSQNDLARLQDKLLRSQFADSIIDRYVTFVPERSKLFVRFDTLYAGDDASKFIGGKRLHDIHLKFSDIKKYAAPFWIHFSYDISLPEHPTAKTLANLSIEFQGDTFYAHHQYDVGTVGAAVPYSRIRGNYRPAVKLADAREKANVTVNALMTKTFGADVARKCFTRWTNPNHNTEQFRIDGAYFVTPTLDSFFVPYEYHFFFAAHPVDLPQTARDFVVSFDADYRQKDILFFRKQIALLPDVITSGEPSGAISEEEAIAQAIEYGMPVAKEGYRNEIRQAGKHYEWTIFSIQRSKKDHDMARNPCETFWGTFVVLDAISRELIKGPTENSYQKGCWD